MRVHDEEAVLVKGGDGIGAGDAHATETISWKNDQTQESLQDFDIQIWINTKVVWGDISVTFR